MLDSDLKDQLQAYLQKLTRPVELVAALDDGEGSRELRELLVELTQLSDKVSLREAREPGDRVPSFAIASPAAGHDISLRFAGTPLGHEFTSLVLALLQVGGHPPKLDAATIDRIRALEGDYAFETFFSLDCHNCPDVVQALNLMAVLNPRIRHVAIDGARFQDEVAAREVMSVPAVFLNGEIFAYGRMGIDEILAKLDASGGARAAAELSEKAPYDVLIVGGGPAGAAAGIYAARKGIRTGIVAERFGGQVLDTMAIENFISVPETDGPKLAAAMERHVRDYEVDIMNLQRAERLLPAGDDGLVEVQLASGASLKSKTVLLSTGARWRQMNVPGEEQYRNKGVAYCPHCDGPLFKGKRVAVVGGGNSGVEAAIDLAGIVEHVTLIEFDSKLRADEVLQRKLRSLPNVRVIVSAQTTEVLGDGRRVNALAYVDRTTHEAHVVPLEGVFVQIGLLPNTEWLKGTVELTPRGEIIIDDRGQTSLPGVFAAGDATTVPYKQIVIAMSEGSKAALSAFDHLIRHSAPAESAVAQAS
ncbi:alkyl hydroperoxide reductase subunit F [Lysobacter brunescens]|uniref:Alkyl hydroperoxide reductase subunit F n=1 Tax=Lysobacter brunescens TaxID=262323 RepID=A0ABW2Y6B6_9GAMM